MTDTLDDLIKRLEEAEDGVRELDAALAEEFGVARCAGGIWPFTPGSQMDKEVPHYTTSIDPALTLLPKTAINHYLMSFGGHGEDHIKTDNAWAFSFMDTEITMGERAAREQIARMNKNSLFKPATGKPKIILEKAIAGHFVEFYCRCAPTPALALCVAALRARNHTEANE